MTRVTAAPSSSPVLQLGQLLHKLGRQDVRPGREELAELDKGGAQVEQPLAGPPGQPPGADRPLLGRLPTRVAPLLVQEPDPGAQPASAAAARGSVADPPGCRVDRSIACLRTKLQMPMVLRRLSYVSLDQSKFESRGMSSGPSASVSDLERVTVRFECKAVDSPLKTPPHLGMAKPCGLLLLGVVPGKGLAGLTSALPVAGLTSVLPVDEAGRVPARCRRTEMGTVVTGSASTTRWAPLPVAGGGSCLAGALPTALQRDSCQNREPG